MDLTGLVARLARAAPVRVFPVVGQGAREAMQELTLDPRVRFVPSPRSANVLLGAGAVTHQLLRPAVSVHDQLSHPRCTVWWPLGAPTQRISRLFPAMTVADAGTDVVEVLIRVHREVLRGGRPSDPSILPDVDPAPWRGVGPYGQGGKGMTGGVPYGRTIAGRAPDRDGLELDQLQVRVGPFFPPFPPGLVLDVRLQGDLTQEVVIGANPFRRAGPVGPDAVFHAALSRPMPINVIEHARAGHHLRWLAHMLCVHGLHALGLRTLRMARDVTTESVGALRRLQRLLQRTRALDWATAGVGLLPEGVARTVGGPIARAAGLGADARMDDPGYLALGFEPIVHTGGDARARWRQRLAEAVQSMELARSAGSWRTSVTGRVESPRGCLTQVGSSAVTMLKALPDALAGLEWGDAVTTVVSLDLDVEAAA